MDKESPKLQQLSPSKQQRPTATSVIPPPMYTAPTAAVATTHVPPSPVTTKSSVSSKRKVIENSELKFNYNYIGNTKKKK